MVFLRLFLIYWISYLPGVQSKLSGFQMTVHYLLFQITKFWLYLPRFWLKFEMQMHSLPLADINASQHMISNFEAQSICFHSLFTLFELLTALFMCWNFYSPPIRLHVAWDFSIDALFHLLRRLTRHKFTWLQESHCKFSTQHQETLSTTAGSNLTAEGAISKEVVALLRKTNHHFTLLQHRISALLRSRFGSMPTFL